MERLNLCNKLSTSAALRMAIVVGTVLSLSSAQACSGVAGAGVPVLFGDQTNIIIWDDANHVEHFIRNASFRSGAPDFGFIAPTPGKPELSEASQKAFYTLAKLAPNQYSGGGGGMGGGMGGLGRERPPEVRVIQEADVAGYHATTVFSTNTRAMYNWMKDRGYVSTPEIEEWIDRYTKKGWYLTAFKVSDKAKAAASTGTIRMSFETERPFNPFYVPKTNFLAGQNGTLCVYFVSTGNYDAHYGYSSQTWQTPQWTSLIPKPLADSLAQSVKLDASAIPNRPQVEEFVDSNFPRPAPDDIFFTKRPLPAPVKEDPPAPKPIPPSAFFVLASLPLLVIRRRSNQGRDR